MNDVLSAVIPKRAALSKHFRRIAWLATLMTASTIVFGAFVRLSDAGLSCPDWPTCYGRATWPSATHEVLDHAALKIRPLEAPKMWREQVHRFLAGMLSLEVLGLALVAARKHRLGVVQVVVAPVLVGFGIPLYLHGEHAWAMASAVLGEAVLLFAAIRWSNEDLSRIAVLALATIFLQALLGMWTVTWLLKPVVVVAHLLCALLLFCLLLWMAWRATDWPIHVPDAKSLRRWLLAVLVVVAAQIALGGWTSANYAALACGGGAWDAANFPKCVNHWWPPHDFANGFSISRDIGVDYEGGVLDGAARIAIQMAHRIGAAATALASIALMLKLLRMPGMWSWAVGLLCAVLLQITLGVLNVKLALPLPVAVAHNGGAVLLLFMLVSLLARLRAPE